MTKIDVKLKDIRRTIRMWGFMHVTGLYVPFEILKLMQKIRKDKPKNIPINLQFYIKELETRILTFVLDKHGDLIMEKIENIKQRVN